jgi:hypothetical protein
LCLSAVYSGRPLPARKDRNKKKEGDKEKEKDRKEKGSDRERSSSSRKKKDEKVDPSSGTFRTNSQGVYDGEDLALDPELLKKAPTEKRKVDPNSALARRLAAAGKAESTIAGAQEDEKVDDFAAFPATSDFSVDFDNTAAFGEFDAKAANDNGAAFGEFDAAGGAGVDIDEAFGVPAGGGSDWGEGSESNGTKFDAFSSFSPDGVEMTEGNIDDAAPEDIEEGVETEESNHHRHRRRSSKAKVSSSSEDDDVDDGGEAEKGNRRGHLRRTRSSARRSKPDVTKPGDESDALGALVDGLGDADESTHRRAIRPSSRSRGIKKEGVRRSASNSDEVKDVADRVRKDSAGRHTSSRTSSTRKSSRSKDEEVKPDP